MSQRTLLFWLLCIPTRIFIAVFTYMLRRVTIRLHAVMQPLFTYTPGWELALGLSLPYMCIGFGFIQTTHARDTIGLMFGGKAWWLDLRPVHAMLWTFAWGCVLSGAYEVAAGALLLDVLVGVVVRVDRIGYVEGDKS